MVVAVEDPLGNGQGLAALPQAQEPAGQDQKRREYAQGPGETVVQVGAEAMAVDESGIDHERRRGRDRRRQGNADQVGAHVLVADGEAADVAGAAHAHPGQPENQYNIACSDQVLEQLGSHGGVPVMVMVSVRGGF